MSLPVTEDTPPDMLAGSMDLNVVLPNGKSVKMSIQRSTPMMDLLVQVTTANRLSPGNHSIQAVGDRGVLPYKPSTPIGTLDAFTIKIVDKKLNSHKKAPQVPQSFLNTFRLQVNLPRSQLFVARVTPDITLAEILNHVCTEKNLDIKKYEFRSPGNPEEVLELDRTLGSYKIQELSLVNKNNRAVGVLLSSADILHVKSSKHRQNSMCDSSLSSGSLGSRSTSPVPVNVTRIPPQPPIRKKRRPAPKPPQINESEKKEDMKTTRQGLISHSRESSDSSGYHEASVLSESPTHGVPLGRSETNSPPDTLPRHSKLAPSQSFTNLATIQPVARPRLVNSVSNASLNSNGVCRKKRAAPPPPPTYHAATTDEKMKSSTLPTSRAEERIISNVPFVTGDKVDFVEEANTKVDTVESIVESESSLIAKTKVDVGTSNAEEKPALDVAVKPVPKPRTLLNGQATGNRREQRISMSRSQTDSMLEGREGKANSPESRDLSEKASELVGDNLKEVKSAPRLGEEEEFASGMSQSKKLERWKNVDTLACLNEDDTKATKTAWLLGDSEASGDVSPVEETDHDSLNWQYQLPPPPTDFRDAHSPNFTEFGTVTITPDIYKEEEDENRSFKPKDCAKTAPDEAPRTGDGDRGGETRLANSKPVIMSELTNVLAMKEKSSSVTNLYVGGDNRKSTGLSYSKSFTNELPIKNMKMSMYETFGAENEKYENEIKYKNYKNLEKSLSMECIQTRGMEEADGKAEEGCRRSVAPVQKKIKVAKRSSSTINTEQRKSESDLDFDQDGDSNIAALRQHFIDFLKEKKLTNDLNMKSLDVMRHILPQINGESKEGRQDKPVPSVKVIDFKPKTNPLSDVKENVVIIQKVEKEEPEIRAKEIQVRKEPKRYSYHEPPSINFATWGERPKTQVFIKDEDYVTEDKVTKKMEKKTVEEAPKPIVMKKPSVIQFKKPGVKSHYEMFSALPKKKEVTSLTLIQMEDEEKKKKKMMTTMTKTTATTTTTTTTTKKVTTEPSRVPVVCGAELKKEFREKQGNRSISVTEVNVEPEVRQPHSVSIYINSEQKKEERNVAPPKPLITNYFNPQRKTTLMPVVKGFRMIPTEQSRLYCNGGSNVNSVDVKNESSAGKSQRKHVSEVSLPPPPPPPPTPPSAVSFLANLKPVSARQIKPKTDSVNPRDQLMADIRNFRGFKINKSAQ